MSMLAEAGHEVLLQWEPRVIAADRNAHATV
jgi:hypothetical protein